MRKKTPTSEPSCGYAGFWAQKLEETVLQHALHPVYAQNLAKAILPVNDPRLLQANSAGMIQYTIHRHLNGGLDRDMRDHVYDPKIRKNAKYRLNAAAVTLDDLEDEQKTTILSQLHINQRQLKKFRTLTPQEPSVLQFFKDVIDSTGLRGKTPADRELRQQKAKENLKGMRFIQENAIYHRDHKAPEDSLVEGHDVHVFMHARPL
ncbi:MAG: hypothetical protein JWM96_938 [Alphaproteobacteria bacterium]|nr:hypothetical protein [Alphaproteobacteria bacterium]